MTERPPASDLGATPPPYGSAMSLIQVLQLVLLEAVGGRGAAENCRLELERNRAAERQIDALQRRLPPARPATALRRSA